ncbi:MAG: hypothetical protein M3237_14040 [Actinomycetota bacterium]|nr:hypothetical protein [Actinomycetota bacterium]
MTERLAQLMHAEADHLVVPPPNAGAALSQGRGLRRRRRFVTGATATAVVLVIGGGALAVNAITGDDKGSNADPAAAFDSGAVFSIGATVYAANGEVEAAIEDKAIKSLYYTSAGVLVRHGNNPYSDGGGPQRFSIVRPDGSVDPIDVTTEETVHSTDPTQPYLAYAEETAAGVDVVLRDLRDDTEAARVSIPGPFDKNAWMPPPISLSGELVYITTSPTAYVVDWRSGEVTATDAIEPGGYVEVHGGRETVDDRFQARVVDAATGETLLSAPITQDQFGGFSLSPDGSYALLSIEDMMASGEAASTVDVYDVETGEHVSVPRNDYGWTVDGDLFSVSKGKLTTCDTATGDCTTVPHGIQMPPRSAPREVCETFDGHEECYTEGGETWEGQLKLGGRTYES